MQVEVDHVRADVAGAAETDLGVHIRAVHVNLSAVVVDDPADVEDRAFEDAVRGGVGDHQRGEVIPVGIGAGAEVGQVDVALTIAADGNDLITGHDGAGGIGAVGTGRDEADFAVALPARLVVAANGEEAGVFALRPGVGLEADGGQAGDLAEPFFQLVRHDAVTFGLHGGREGVDLAELGPRHG